MPPLVSQDSLPSFVPVDKKQLLREMKRTYVLLDCYLHQQSAKEDLANILGSDVITAIPEFIETLQLFAFDLNQYLETLSPPRDYFSMGNR